MRRRFEFVPKDESLFTLQLRQKAAAQLQCVLLEDLTTAGTAVHQYTFLGGFEVLSHCEGAWSDLRAWSTQHRDWRLGYFSYDLKNEFEQLTSQNSDLIGFPLFCFYQPRYVVLKEEGQWRVEYLQSEDTEESVRRWIHSLPFVEILVDGCVAIQLNERVSKSQYLSNVKAIQQHIVRGDIYEINYCVELYKEAVQLDVIQLYTRLLNISPVPFAAFVRSDDRYLMCASPERYIQKQGKVVVSQPIKGTAPRSHEAEEDRRHRQQLLESEKERSENIMITDLVRNDLARIAERGSVNVDELCGIYAFQQVYQMISTVSAQLSEEHDWLDVIKATFPMGSMTGAPKVKAMELIEAFEDTKRGLYSGAVGYVTPDDDFDFNVVIRSLQYHQPTGYLSTMVGSAITAMSDPESEYRECLLKASAIKRVLERID